MPKINSLFIICILHIITHSSTLNKIAMGKHVWRQCNSLAMAKNFYAEDYNILHPKVDVRYTTNGIAGPPFPLYEFGLATIYKLLGFNEYTHRYYSLIISLVSIVGIWFLFFTFFHNKLIANLAAFICCFLPEYYYYASNALPDLLGFCFMIWGIVFILKYSVNMYNIQFILGFIFFVLATSIKVQFSIGLLFFIPQFFHSIKSKNYLLGFSIFCLVLSCFIAFVTWNLYTKSNADKNGLAEFLSVWKPPSSWPNFVSVLGQNLISDLPEVFVGYIFVIFLIFGLFFINYKQIFNSPFFYFFMGAIIFYVLMQNQFKQHGYYYFIFIIPLLFVISKTAIKIINHSKLKWVIVLFALAPAWAFLRNEQYFKQPQSKIPEIFTANNFRILAQKNSLTHANKWVTGPDVSGTIFHYYLGSKGYPFMEMADTIKFDNYVKRGAKGLITNKVNLISSVQKKYNWKILHHADSFYWIGEN